MSDRPQAEAKTRRRFTLTVEWVLVGILVLVGIAMAQLSAGFLAPSNLLDMTRFIVEIGLLSLPMTLIIITKGIDLSVGSNIALSAIAFGYTWHAGVPLVLAALIGIATGTVAGLVNGWTVAYLGVPPLVTTLATFGAFRGIALGLSQGRGVSGFPQWFYVLGQGEIGPVPVQLLVLIVAAIVFWIVLHLMGVGKRVYAIGLNERAARFSGVRVRSLLLRLYGLSGFMAGLAAIIYVSRVGTAKGNAATGYELEAITAVILGGTSIAGGVGTIPGTLLGIAIIISLRFGMILGGVSANVRSLTLGLALIVAVLAYGLLARERK